jgi:hypothetical protein
VEGSYPLWSDHTIRRGRTLDRMGRAPGADGTGGGPGRDVRWCGADGVGGGGPGRGGPGRGGGVPDGTCGGVERTGPAVVWSGRRWFGGGGARLRVPRGDQRFRPFRVSGQHERATNVDPRGGGPIPGCFAGVGLGPGAASRGLSVVINASGLFKSQDSTKRPRTLINARVTPPARRNSAASRRRSLGVARSASLARRRSLGVARSASLARRRSLGVTDAPAGRHPLGMGRPRPQRRACVAGPVSERQDEGPTLVT